MFGGFFVKCCNFVVVLVSCVCKFSKYVVIFNWYFYFVLVMMYDVVGLCVVGKESFCFDKCIEVNFRYLLMFFLFFFMWI